MRLPIEVVPPSGHLCAGGLANVPRRKAQFDLDAAIRSPGFTPRATDVESLLDLLASADEPTAERAERALGRLAGGAVEAIRARFEGAEPPLRGRLCRLIGRIALGVDDARTLIEFLVERLADGDAKTRRNAIIALGKLGGSDARDALIAFWDTDPGPAERRSLAAAFGKIGDGRALERLKATDARDAELQRIAREAILKLERTLLRSSEPGRIDGSAAATTPLAIRFHCRRGLEQLLADEIDVGLMPRVEGSGRVAATLTGSLSELWTPRIALRFGFPLEVAADSATDLEKIVVDALSLESTVALLRTFTRGPIRYRIEWSGCGHRRALTFRVARSVSERTPELVNDPRAPLWELVVREGRRGVELELWPRGLPDPRFTYRQRLVPAASHPTLAAAVARVGGVRKDDIVWDPFVGAGTELIERARLGAFRALYGSDRDRAALAAARHNLKSAGVVAELDLADARTHRPKARPTLVITNPPMGRRVLDRHELDDLYGAFLAHAAAVLSPGGRLVWISALPALTLRLARACRLSLELAQRVDMGGFDAEIQRFSRGAIDQRDMASKGRPYRTLTIDGFEVLIGRGDEENDYLTFEVAEPYDLWLHAGGGTPGSHVVIRNPDRLSEIPKQVVERAAGLAAWYSKARAARQVEVHVCRVRDVSKRRDAPAGQVTLARWKKVRVRPTKPDDDPSPRGDDD